MFGSKDIKGGELNVFYSHLGVPSFLFYVQVNLSWERIGRNHLKLEPVIFSLILGT